MTALTTELRETRSWVLDALCAQTDPELFFPELGGTAEPAKRVCAACPVNDECLQYALARPELLGVWGGTTERQRQAIRANGHTTGRAAEQEPGRAGRERAA